MCVGALVHARVARLVFGAYDRRRGAVCSAFDLIASPALNHVLQWQGGLLAKDCQQQLQAFFRLRR